MTETVTDLRQLVGGNHQNGGAATAAPLAGKTRALAPVKKWSAQFTAMVMPTLNRQRPARPKARAQFH